MFSKRQYLKSIYKATDTSTDPIIGKDLVGTPRFGAFADWDYLYLLAEISWRPSKDDELTFRPVEVPQGFVTDLTSVPRLLRFFLPREGRYAYAAVVHDYLYWVQTHVSRQQADKIFWFAMRDQKVPAWKMRLIHSAVSWLGGFAWRANAQLRKSGERRVLYAFPEDPGISWVQWKANPRAFV
jgi:Protein of unknown function (DUF1353)